ncbi:MAG TPA: MerR family transcriptional regulator [Deinococcales bacterium]|nr:MerR family transcriptional regulator [Deinococcales bacterium]
MDLASLRYSRWTLDEFVDAANHLLPQHLPEERRGNLSGEVNARLVRHYATQGHLDDPEKEGREARYTYRHLLQLLALRKAMALGYGTSRLMELTHRPDDALEAFLTGGAQLELSPNPALAYIRSVRAGRAPDGPPPASPSPDALYSRVDSPPAPPRWIRIELAPGLELHAREGARLPETPVERQALLSLIERRLLELSRS